MENPYYAYCAGLYEGEGSIGCSFSMDYRNRNPDKKPVRKLVLKISMTDVEPLIHFADFMELGSVTGPYELASGKMLYEYRIGTFEDVKLAIDRMYPWLSPRRQKQADAAIAKYLEKGPVRRKGV